MDLTERQMDLTENGIGLVIESQKWLKLLQNGLVNLREVLRCLYGIQLVTEGYDAKRRIEFDVIYIDGKRVGKAFITGDDTDALERGEEVEIEFAF